MMDERTALEPVTAALEPVTATQRPRARGNDSHGRGGGSGVILAVLVLLVVVFAAGLTIGQGLSGQAASSTASPIAVASPTPTPVPTSTATPTSSPSSAETPGTSPPSASSTPASPPPTPLPTPSASAPTATVPPGAPADFAIFWQALQLVREQYVDRASLTDEQLTYGAIRGMVLALGDTGHSIFMTPEDVVADRDSLSGTVTGIGAILGERNGNAIIVSVISGAPADRAGLRPGDIIIAVDGDSVARLTTEQIVAKVRGEAGTRVELTIRHPDSTDTVDVSMVRERINVPAVTWAFVPGTQIADVRLIQFSSGAANAVKAALQEAIDDGAVAIVLDMRSNPGGLVDEAVGAASQFLADGVVYQRQDATGTKLPVDVRPGGIATELPLVVIVDEGTASSAEIVAGALQDSERAEVIGTQTFGTGTVLNQFPLADGSAVRLGVEHWLTPDGDLIFGNGIEPDEVVELPSGASPLEPAEIEDLAPAQFEASTDAQLLRAVEILVDELGD